MDNRTHSDRRFELYRTVVGKTLTATTFSKMRTWPLDQVREFFVECRDIAEIAYDVYVEPPEEGDSE